MALEGEIHLARPGETERARGQTRCEPKSRNANSEWINLSLRLIKDLNFGIINRALPRQQRSGKRVARTVASNESRPESIWAVATRVDTRACSLIQTFYYVGTDERHVLRRAISEPRERADTCNSIWSTSSILMMINLRIVVTVATTSLPFCNQSSEAGRPVNLKSCFAPSKIEDHREPTVFFRRLMYGFI